MESEHAKIERAITEAIEENPDFECPNCSADYDRGNVHYLGQMNSHLFLHATCRKCKTPAFMACHLVDDDLELIDNGLSPAEDKMVRVPVTAGSARPGAADLIPGAYYEEPVTYDDVLDIHQYLNRTDIKIDFDIE